MLVWVIYDISDDRRRNHVAKICKNYGLYRVQKSTFLGTLNRNEWDSLALEAGDEVEDDDSLYIFPVCDDCFRKIKLIGEGFDKDLVRDELGVKFF